MKGKFVIEREFKSEVIFETSIAVGGNSYLIIYGKHINGYFCAVPGWGWGCEMTEANEVTYNRDKLISCGANKAVAQALAEAILCIWEGKVNNDVERETDSSVGEDAKTPD